MRPKLDGLIGSGDVRQVHHFRSLADLAERAAACALTGDLIVREIDGTEHRVVFRSGTVVDVQVAGRFDPILTALLEQGALSPRRFVTALEGLGRSQRRAGDLALDLGVPRYALSAALRAQGERRFAALLVIAQRRGRDAFLQSRNVSASDVAFRLELLPLLGSNLGRGMRGPRHRSLSVRAPTRRTPRDRRTLRRLAFALHPDRHPHLSDIEREGLARRLAEVTAEFHGL